MNARLCVPFCMLFFIVPTTAAIQAAERSSEGQNDTRPNILFILVDDLGWSDLGCYGHPWHETPNLDRLASRGMRFTDAYAPAPICSASRASILTGKTVARVGLEFVTKDKSGRQKIDVPTLLQAPPLTLNLPLKEVTIAEHLKDAGYQTAFFGKWHVSQHYKRYLGWSPTHGPKQQGFDFAEEDFGAHPYVWKTAKPKTMTEPGTFPVDTMIRRVCKYLQSVNDDDAPFFLMASSFYVHTPVRTTCDWLVEKYAARVPASSPQRKERIQYAAFVETLDHYVGEILTTLEERGLAHNTLVVFFSDNGGHPLYTANGPLRGSKWNLYEGGIRIPMICSWPGHIQPNSTTATPVIGYDLLPTFADVAGLEPPVSDGISLKPLFENPNWSPKRELIWHFPYYHPETTYSKAKETIGVNDFAISKTKPHSAMRQGNLKLIWDHETNKVQLYDLKNDLAEQKDLAEARPKVAEKLSIQLRAKLQAMHARMPTPSEHE